MVCPAVEVGSKGSEWGSQILYSMVIVTRLLIIYFRGEPLIEDSDEENEDEGNEAYGEEEDYYPAGINQDDEASHNYNYNNSSSRRQQQNYNYNNSSSTRQQHNYNSSSKRQQHNYNYNNLSSTRQHVHKSGHGDYEDINDEDPAEVADHSLTGYGRTYASRNDPGNEMIDLNPTNVSRKTASRSTISSTGQSSNGICAPIVPTDANVQRLLYSGQNQQDRHESSPIRNMPQKYYSGRPTEIHTKPKYSRKVSAPNIVRKQIRKLEGILI